MNIKLMGALVLAIFCISCSNSQNSVNVSDNFQDNTVILTEENMDLFLKLLPELLRFSDQYTASLSEKELESKDYNEKYFKALEASKTMNDLFKENNISSKDFLLLYQNVSFALGYYYKHNSSFEKDMTQYVDYITSELAKNDDLLKGTSDPKEKEKLEYEQKELIAKQQFIKNADFVREYEGQINQLTTLFNDNI